MRVKKIKEGFGAWKISRVIKTIRNGLDTRTARIISLNLPPAAKKEAQNDSFGLSGQDPGLEVAITEAFAWLCRAQDNSNSHDGGVASHYSLITGWSSSYPETTGYLVPTMIAYARLRNVDEARERARKMLDWLVSIQFPEGGFQGGLIDSKPCVPVSFNTGQILIGLATGAREFGDFRYYEAMCRAADWLVRTQDSDGCWRRHPTPFAMVGDKAYETHVSFGLLEAARIAGRGSYADAAVANIGWALGLQRANGWFAKCCLTDPSQPLTHTLGYVLRGILETYRFTKDTNLLNACCKTADGLLEAALLQEGFIPGRLDQNWKGTVSWSCLTGGVQVAHCWLMLYRYTGNRRYRDAALAVNQYVRRSIKLNGSAEMRGGIKGSFPINGNYGTYKFLSWACKFFVDAHILEKDVRENDPVNSSLRENLKQG